MDAHNPIAENESSGAHVSAGSELEVNFIKRVCMFYQEYKSLLGRSLAFAYSFCIWSILFYDCKPDFLTFFAYLTHWGWTACVMYFFIAFAHDLKWRIRRNEHLSTSSIASAEAPFSETASLLENNKMNNDAAVRRCCVPAANKSASKFSSWWPFRYFAPSNNKTLHDDTMRSLWWRIFQQVFAELAFVLQVVVVSFFWMVVYPQEPHRSIWWELQSHGMGFVLVLLDYLCRRFNRFSLRNFQFVLFFGILYMLCHIIVVVVSGQPIYPGIHFRDLRSFLVGFAATSTLLVTHKLVYLYSNWDRIRGEIKSFVDLIHVLIFGKDTFSESPLWALWYMLTDASSIGKHIAKNNANRSRKIRTRFNTVSCGQMPANDKGINCKSLSLSQVEN